MRLRNMQREGATGWRRAVVGCHFLADYTFAFVGAMEARYLIWQVPLPWESVKKCIQHYVMDLEFSKLYYVALE